MQGKTRSWMKGLALGMPMLVAWLYGVFQSKWVWLVLLLIAYFSAPMFGIEPLSPVQVVDVFIQNPDSWMAVVTIVVAIVAAGSFMASKRLDMRLAAADDIQKLLRRMTDVASEDRLAADALVSFRKYAETYPKGAKGDEAATALRQIAPMVLVTVSKVAKDQGRMWEIYKDAIALQSRHRLALSSSSVCALMFGKGLSGLDQLASSRGWIYPINPDDLDDLYNWCSDSRSEWVEGYSQASQKIEEQVSFFLGGSAGAVAGTLFTTSAVAAWNAWLGIVRN